jgi:proteasome endopeptidase complex, beta component (EC 3.4.25.1). Threonine peptidase. MEROPS family T01A
MSIVLPGTAVGVKTRDGVMLASEKRVSYDGFILSRQARKVYPVTSRNGVAFAGVNGGYRVFNEALEA